MFYLRISNSLHYVIKWAFTTLCNNMLNPKEVMQNFYLWVLMTAS